MNDAPTPVNPYVFLRGAAGQKGPEVPRQSRRALAEARKPFEHGSGGWRWPGDREPRQPTHLSGFCQPRLDVAFSASRWSPSPSDFGLPRPTPHPPELLDGSLRASWTTAWS